MRIIIKTYSKRKLILTSRSDVFTERGAIVYQTSSIGRKCQFKLYKRYTIKNKNKSLQSCIDCNEDFIDIIKEYIDDIYRKLERDLLEEIMKSNCCFKILFHSTLTMLGPTFRWKSSK